VLYREELFEPLTETHWDSEPVRDGIRRIVVDVEAGYRGAELLWPADPLRDWNPTDPMTCVYDGAAGTVFALDALQRRGHAETGLDLPGIAVSSLELFRRRPDYEECTLDVPEPRDAAFLTGETGILLLAWRLAPADELADALYARVRENTANEAEDVMWGTPGTLIAASAMLAWTNDERWLAAGRESAEALLARRDADRLWTQRLYSETFRGLGPIHGAVGNVQALCRLLEPERGAELEDAMRAVLARTAVVEDGLANWPHAASADPPEFLRWCSGAPGIIASTNSYLDEELLLAAAELVWSAGPAATSIGPSICCGTAGNGYALLKVFERTGDERWLERARRFAVHALEQVERDRARGGPGWYSLWKGDPGVALFAADCLEGRAVHPLLDAWFEPQ